MAVSYLGTLVDSGIRRENNIKRINLKAELLDGTLVPMDLCSENMDLCIGEAKFKILPYIVDWIAYDIILGESWLTSVNPMIDWTRNHMRIKINDQIITLDAESHKHRASSYLTCYE